MRILAPILILLQMAVGQTITASVDVNQLAVNETFTFKIEAKDADNLPQVNLFPLEKDFTVISGPAQQTSYQFINGEATSSKSLTWTLVPNKKGKLVIPSLTVVLEGRAETRCHGEGWTTVATVGKHSCGSSRLHANA